MQAKVNTPQFDYDNLHEIDCMGQTLKKSMVNQVLNGQFKIGKVIGQGNDGIVFDVAELSPGRCERATPLAVKISSNTLCIAHEIKVLKRVKN